MFDMIPLKCTMQISKRCLWRWDIIYGAKKFKVYIRNEGTSVQGLPFRKKSAKEIVITLNMGKRLGHIYEWIGLYQKGHLDALKPSSHNHNYSAFSRHR